MVEKAVANGRRKWRGNVPFHGVAEEKREKDVHDSAAFIKLNVSFPDRAFPESSSATNFRSVPFRGNLRADRVGLLFLHDFEVAFHFCETLAFKSWV